MSGLSAPAMAEDLDSLLADLELTDTKPAPAKKHAGERAANLKARSL